MLLNKKGAVSSDADSPFFLLQSLAKAHHPRHSITRDFIHDAVAGVNDGGSLAGKDASDISSTLFQFLPG